MEDEQTASAAALNPFAAFLALFYGAWVLRVILLMPVDGLIDNFWLQQCWSQGLRVALWVAPAFIYIRHFEKANPLRYLCLDTLPRGRRFWVGAAIMVVFLMVVAIDASFKGGRVGNVLSTPGERWAQLLVQMSFVALAEEIVFRGLILKKLISLQQQKSRLRPILVSSTLFVLIHVPGWLYMKGADPALFSLAASIFAISCVLGLLFVVTRSLWPPVALHLLNNVVTGIML